jgi:hypothetical protein
MRPVIGAAAAAGALALGGVWLAAARTASPVQAAANQPQAAATAASQPTGPIQVNCGEGRQAVVHSTTTGNETVSRVECVADPAAAPFSETAALQPQSFNTNAPVAPPAQVVSKPVVRERVVYRDRPVQTASRSQAPSNPAPSADQGYGSGDYNRDRQNGGYGDNRTADAGYGRNDGYGNSAPSYPTETHEGRSWKKSAVIIGASAAGGAAVGAVLGGGSGAKKGAIVGALGGTIYDVATRNRNR